MNKQLPVEPIEFKLNEKDFVPFFIYTKDDKCKVLHYKEAAALGHKTLINAKWKHVGTIEPLKWIETLLNDDKALKMINDLNNGAQHEM